MGWFQKLLARLLPSSQAQAEHRVDAADWALADLRAHVRGLPPEQRAAFAKKIQALIDEQAQARNDLNDVLDDRHDR
jgi:hypothetical protein